MNNIPLLLSHAHELLDMWKNNTGPVQSAAALRRIYFRQRPYMGSRDRRFIEFLFFDVIRNLRLYEWQILQNHRKPENKEAAAFLLIHSFMKHYPKMAEHIHFRDSDPLGRLLKAYRFDNILPDDPAIRYSVPELLWMETAPHYAPEVLESCYRRLLEPATVHIRVNPLKMGRNELRAGIRNIPLDYGLLSPLALRTGIHAQLERHRLYRDGCFEFQDESSQLVAYACDPGKNDQIVDICAGAGGKTLHLAALQGDKGRIIASDLESKRLGVLEIRAKRADLRSIKIEKLNNISTLKVSADILLIDAPCSGSGVYGRHPDRKWALSRKKLDYYIKTQEEILENYSGLVRKGGILVYATCSLIPAENGRQIEKFLKRHPEFTCSPLQAVFDKYDIPLSVPGNAGMLQILPQEYESDGFFIARLQRS